MNDLNGIMVVASLLLASVLGFVAHRASVCTVKAVAEVVSTGQGYMFLSFFKTVLWVMAITVPFMWWWPEAHGNQQSLAISIPALVGGLLFGMGAALNKGCAFSTLSRLGDGNLGMLVTLAGFCAGIYTHARLSDAYTLPQGTLLESTYATPTIWTIGLLGALWVWVVREMIRLWRTRRPRAPWWELARSHRYRLSTAAAVIGVSNALLYAFHGSWAYTGTISQEIRHVATGDAGSSVIQWGLFAALLFGMGWSSWRRHSFRLVWRPSLSWAMSFPAGLLMGLGAALVPGGNDVLILHSIPALSPHALSAYLGMLAGIALPLVLMRVTRGAIMGVDCSGDVCKDGRSQVPVDRAAAVSRIAT